MPEQNLFLKIIRFVIFLIYFIAYMLTSFFIVFTTPDLWRQRAKIAKMCQFFSKITLKMMGVSVQIEKRILTRNHLVVSNHLSYLDVMVISANYPSVFVTSVEMKETPFLGFFTKLGGCLYVERRNKENLNNEIVDITNGLSRGLNVCIFPESTSTNGDCVLRFRKPLFQAAINSQTPIKTLTLNYQSVNDQPITFANRDRVAWYGDMSFLPHLLGILGTRKITVRIDHGNVLFPDLNEDPKDLAARSQIEVEKNYVSLAESPAGNSPDNA